MNLLLSLVLLSDPRGSAVDFSGGAVTEVRGGRAPLNIGEDPIPSMMFTIAPITRVHASTRAHDGRAMLSYSPRLYFRFPNRLQLSRPLLLHQAFAGYSRRVTPRWELGGQATVSAGELDYTNSQAVFGNQQSNLPNTTVTRYAASNAAFRVAGAISPVQQISIVPSVDYRTPYGESAEPSNDPALAGIQTLLPRQIGANLGVLHTLAVTRSDTLLAEVQLQYVDFDTRGAYAIATGTYGWSRRLSPRLASTLRAGAYGSRETRTPDGINRTFSGSPVQPLIAADIDGRLYNRARLRISGRFGVSSAAFLDSVTGEVVPQAGAQSQISFFLPPRWTVGAEANFFTVATRRPRNFALTDPLPGQMADPAAQQETVLSWRTPVSYNLHNRYGIEFGTIGSVRGPHLRAGTFRFRQLEAWLYVAFSFDFATGHVRERRAGGGGATVSGGAVN